MEETSGFRSPDFWFTVYNNLGHVTRKQGHYEDAIEYYERALLYRPKQAAVMAAIGLCRLLMGEDGKAVSLLHTALSVDKHDTITLQLLQISLEGMSQSSVGDDDTTAATSVSYDASDVSTEVSTATQSTCSSIELSCDSVVACERKGKNESECGTIEMCDDSSLMSIEISM